MSTEKLAAIGSLASALIALVAVGWGIIREDNIKAREKIRFTINVVSVISEKIDKEKKELSKIIISQDDVGSRNANYFEYSSSISRITDKVDVLIECIKNDVCDRKIICTTFNYNIPNYVFVINAFGVGVIYSRPWMEHDPFLKDYINREAEFFELCPKKLDISDL